MNVEDMAKKYDLHHWDNFRIKNHIIVAWCALKNDIYLVYKGIEPVATFQTRKTGNSCSFQKLATAPKFSGGIGTYCMKEIERLAKEYRSKEITCEVYDKCEHAKSFYEHRGYTVCGEIETLKYKELKMRKKI